MRIIRRIRHIRAHLALRVRYGVSMGIATRKTLNFPWLRMAFGLVQALAIIVLVWDLRGVYLLRCF